MSRHAFTKESPQHAFLIRFTFAYLFLTLFVVPAQAKFLAQSTKNLGATTSSWGVVLTSQNATPFPTPYSITWPQSQTTQITYLDVVNFKSLTVNGQILTVNTDSPDSPRQNAPKISFDACVNGIWNSIANTCSGTITNIGVTQNGTLTSSIAITPSSRLSLRLSADKTFKVNWTTVLNVSVNRSQIRVKTVTNS